MDGEHSESTSKSSKSTSSSDTKKAKQQQEQIPEPPKSPPLPPADEAKKEDKKRKKSATVKEKKPKKSSSAKPEKPEKSPRRGSFASKKKVKLEDPKNLSLAAMKDIAPKINLSRASFRLIKDSGKKYLFDLVIDTMIEKNLSGNEGLIQLLSHSRQFPDICVSLSKRLEFVGDNKKLEEVLFGILIRAMSLRENLSQSIGEWKDLLGLLNVWAKLKASSEDWVFLMECDKVFKQIFSEGYTGNDEEAFRAISSQGPYLPMLVAAFAVGRKANLTPALAYQCAEIFAKPKDTPTHLIGLGALMGGFTAKELIAMDSRCDKLFNDKSKKKLCEMLQKLLSTEGIGVRAALRALENIGHFYEEPDLPGKLVASNIKTLEKTLVKVEGQVKVMFAQVLSTMGSDAQNDEKFEEALVVLAGILRKWKGPYNEALKNFCMPRKDSQMLFEALVKLIQVTETARGGIFLLISLDLWGHVSEFHLKPLYCEEDKFGPAQLKATLEIAQFCAETEKFNEFVFAGTLRHLMYAIRVEDEQFEKAQMKEDVLATCKVLVPYFSQYPAITSDLIQELMDKAENADGIEALGLSINECYKEGGEVQVPPQMKEDKIPELIFNLFARIYAAAFEFDTQVMWGYMRTLSAQWKDCPIDPADFLAHFSPETTEKIKKEAEEKSKKRQDALLVLAGLPGQSKEDVQNVVKRVRKGKPYNATLIAQTIRILTGQHFEEALQACVDVRLGKKLMNILVMGEKRLNYYRLLSQLLTVLHKQLLEKGKDMDANEQKLVFAAIESLIPPKKTKMEKHLSDEIGFISEDMNNLTKAAPSVEFSKQCLPIVLWAKSAPVLANQVDTGDGYIEKVMTAWEQWLLSGRDYSFSKGIIESIYSRIPEVKTLILIVKSLRRFFESQEPRPFADMLLKVAEAFNEHQLDLDPSEFIDLIKDCSSLALVNDIAARRDGMIAVYVLGKVPQSEGLLEELNKNVTIAWRMRMWMRLLKACCQKFTRSVGVRLLEVLAEKGKELGFAHSIVVRAVLSCQMPYVTSQEAIPHVAEIIRAYPKMSAAAAFNFENGILKLSYIDMEGFIPIILALDLKDQGRKRVLDLIFGSPEHRMEFATGYNTYLMKQDRDDDEVPSYDTFKLVSAFIDSESTSDMSDDMFSTSFCNLLIWIGYIYGTYMAQKDKKLVENEQKAVAKTIGRLFKRTSVGKIETKVELATYQTLLVVMDDVCKAVADLDTDKVKAVIALGEQMLKSPSVSVQSITALMYIYIVKYMGDYNSQENGRMITRLIKEVARLFENLAPKTRLLIAASCGPQFVDIFKQDDVNKIYTHICTCLEYAPDMFREDATKLFYRLVQKATAVPVNKSAPTLCRVIRRSLVELGMSDELMAALEVYVNAEHNMGNFAYFAMNHQWMFSYLYEENPYRERMFNVLRKLGGVPDDSTDDLTPVAVETAKVVDTDLMLKLAWLLMSKLNVTEPKWFELQCAFACQAIKGDLHGERPKVNDNDKGVKAYEDYDEQDVPELSLGGFKQDFLDYCIDKAQKDKGAIRERALKAIAFIIDTQQN